MRARLHRRLRGQAMTEFALLAPILIIILYWSMYLAELARAKLKVQEAARYTAWEMTSYPLDDYGQARHTQAFELARDLAVEEARNRYRDLDSIDETTPGNMFMGFEGFETRIENAEVPAFTSPVPGLSPGGVGGGFLSTILGGLNGASRFFYDRFGFNTRGQVTVTTQLRLDNRILPRGFLDDGRGFAQVDTFGGRNLQNMQVKNKFTLVASGWDLSIGANARIKRRGAGAPRAGVNGGGSGNGLYTQVKRMMHLGVTDDLNNIPGVGTVLQVVGNIVPNPLVSAYVVSYGYQHGGDAKGCDAQNDGHRGWSGMNNVKSSSGLDVTRRDCYDTAPFRDVASYDGSLYRQMFMARGENFMGCFNAQADDPTVPGRPQHSDQDRNTRKNECGTPPQ